MNKVIKLVNGIPIVFSEMKNMKSFSIGICCRVGSSYEDEYKAGISHLIEHLLFRVSNFEISETIDSIGGELNAFTSREFTIYYANVLSQHANLAVELLSDLVLKPNFTQESLSKEKLIIKEEIAMYQDMFEDLVNEENIKNLFRGSALSQSVLGREDSIEVITLEEVYDYYYKFYIANNFIISIAGNFNYEQIINILEKKWMNLTSKPYNFISIQEDPMHSNLFLSRESSQLHLCINLDGSSYASKEYYTLQIASHILGAGASSRLFKEIRENRGLAYNVYSYLSSYKNTGLFTTYVATNAINFQDVVSVAYDEFYKLASNYVKDEELEKAKNQISASIVFESENSKMEMLRIMNEYYSHGFVKSVEEIIKEVRKVTKEELLQVSAKKFKNRSFTALGDI